MKACGLCGQAGHNARTCKAIETVETVIGPIAIKSIKGDDWIRHTENSDHVARYYSHPIGFTCDLCPAPVDGQAERQKDSEATTHSEAGREDHRGHQDGCDRNGAPAWLRTS